MYQVYICITEQHDLRLVLLAGLICLFATYTTFSLLARAAVAGASARTSWLAAAALALGCGVWATHFVAMLAYHPHMRINYKLGLTVLSILIAVFVSGIGLAIATGGRLRSALIGGAVVGAGIGAMHYTGMAAMDMAARIDYDPTLVAASLLVGIALTCVATGIGCTRFSDTDRTLATLNTLKMAGIHISLDDFGTGYSSLSYLQRFPFDKIKIDRSFVWAMERNADSMAIVRAVIALGHSLRITVTAEGVETENQLALLQKENCDQVQGYLLGRPVPSKDLACLLLAGPQRVIA